MEQLGHECSNGNNKEIVNIVSTRLNDYMQTIRSTLWKNSVRNVLVNIENGMGYEGIIEIRKIK